MTLWTPRPRQVRGGSVPGSKGMAQARVAPSGDQDRLQSPPVPTWLLWNWSKQTAQLSISQARLRSGLPGWYRRVFSADSRRRMCCFRSSCECRAEGQTPAAGLPGEEQSRNIPTSASCSDGSCRDCRWACTITPVQRSRAISRMVFHSCWRYFCRNSTSGPSGTRAGGEPKTPISLPALPRLLLLRQ